MVFPEAELYLCFCRMISNGNLFVLPVCHQLKEQSFVVVKSCPDTSRDDVKVCPLVLGDEWGKNKDFCP